MILYFSSYALVKIASLIYNYMNLIMMEVPMWQIYLNF